MYYFYPDPPKNLQRRNGQNWHSLPRFGNFGVEATWRINAFLKQYLESVFLNPQTLQPIQNIKFILFLRYCIGILKTQRIGSNRGHHDNQSLRAI